ncbi:MAG: non-heme iron oxygenase ferredoxin subunit [Elusimicrobia bacterium]|nr:non-heme iron oxygenase ferredoxin subunit [Elusimicrobiota bacterium]
MTDSFVTLARTEQIPEGAIRVFRAGGRRIAVSRVDGRFYAIDDICTHDGGPLGEGTLMGDEVECPRHGARFNVKTGAVVSMPAVVSVKAYVVRVLGDDVQVEIK